VPPPAAFVYSLRTIFLTGDVFLLRASKHAGKKNDGSVPTDGEKNAQ
jgi:hypothetical protein